MKRNRLIYNTGDIPEIVELEPGDRIRFNMRKQFYTIAETYLGWAIGWRRTSKGYSFVLFSTQTFPETEDLFHEVHHISTVTHVKCEMTQQEAYDCYANELRRAIRWYNAKHEFELIEICFKLEIDKAVRE